GVRALDHLDIGDRAELYLAFKAIFVGRPEEVPVFDRCFDAFWRAAPAEEGIPGLIQVPPAEAPEGDALIKSSSQRRESLALETWGAGEDAGDTSEPLSVPAASESEALIGQDFSTFGADQLDEILRLTIKIARRLAHRITRLTEHLRGRAYRQVLRRLTAVRDWSGGTKIGESLAQFNRESPRLVDRRTIVIILSDGWDTGEPELLAAELLRIKRRAGRVIWLNPLLGNPSYEPLTRGMAAALPLIDDFAPGHNLAALRDLANKLSL